MTWLPSHLDIVGSLLGALGSLLLCLPLFDEIRERSIWDRFSRFRRRAPPPATPEKARADAAVAMKLLDRRLGRMEAQRKWVGLGAALLLLGFLCIAGAGFARL